MTQTFGRKPFRLMIDQAVPMRDGVRLSADLYLPTQGGPFPALLLRTIYDNQEPRYLAWTRRFVQAGYAVVLQDCRGRHDSEGAWDPYLCELEDGFDTHEWVGRQPWCDGNVGTFGLSYPGFTQTLPATLRSKYLKALVPIASQQDNYGHHRVDGVIHHAVSLFFANMMGRTMQRNALEQLDQNQFYRKLPLISALDDIGDNPYYRGVIEHERYDEWWSRYSLRNRYAQVECPALFITGWFDSLLHETLQVFNGWRSRARAEHARRLTKLIVGPWSHQTAPWGREPFDPQGRFEELTFGPQAAEDAAEMHLRWYDARLKGKDDGIDSEPPVRLFIMGANEWRFENEWPLQRAAQASFYLAGNGSSPQGGRLMTEPPGDENPDTFTYDPAHPVPSWGAQYQTLDLSGPRERSHLQERADVLIYTSEVLTRDVEVTGPVSATIYAASSAPDTDFTAALVDLHPDGRSIILCEGIRRARFRKGTDRPELMQPGSWYQFHVDMWDTSNLFKAGHRIRLEISSSNFPRYDRNLNTGGPIGYETIWQVAEQTIYHDEVRPSRIDLPVIPPTPRQTPRYTPAGARSE